MEAQVGSGTGSFGDEITLPAILGALLRRSWLIVFSTVGFCAVGAVLGFVLPKKYKAETLLIAVEQTQGRSAISQMAARLGGVSSLLGLGDSGGQDVQEIVATLTSATVVQELVQKHNLLPVLFVENWDATKEEWIDPEEVPGEWAVLERFREITTVLRDPQTGLITVSIEWEDPVVAARWTNDLVAIADRVLRDRARRRSEENLGYLRGEYDKTSSLEMQNALAELIRVEMQTRMLASGGSEFAIRTLNPALVPEVPSSPRRLLLVVIFGMLGAMLSVAIVGVREIGRMSSTGSADYHSKAT